MYIFGRFSFVLSSEKKSPLPPINDLVQLVPVARGLADGIDELLVVARRVITPTQELAILVGATNDLVVVFHNQVFRQFVPTLHHALCVSDALLV